MLSSRSSRGSPRPPNHATATRAITFTASAISASASPCASDSTPRELTCFATPAHSTTSGRSESLTTSCSSRRPRRGRVADHAIAHGEGRRDPRGLELAAHPDGRGDRPHPSRALGRHRYPHGLAGEEIPLEGRICAICDVYDALGSRRPYKDPWPIARILEEIAQGSGSHFDPALVRAFLELAPELGQDARPEERADIDLDSLPPLFEPEADANGLSPGTRAPFGRHS